MAFIPSFTKFIGIDPLVPTPENKSSQNNAFQQVYTIEDIMLDTYAYTSQFLYQEAQIQIGYDDIILIGDSPITLLQQNPGNYYEIDKIILRSWFDAAPYSTSDLKITYGPDTWAIVNNKLLESTQDRFTIVSPPSSYNNVEEINIGDSFPLSNNEVKITTLDSTNPTAGGGSLEVKIYYKMIKI